MKNLLYILVFLFCGNILAQDNTSLFHRATEDYAAGNYEEAIQRYEQILSNDEVSTSLYYNLANAHYKLNHIAPSIYYYEKALQLSPNDSDVKNNLEFARNMTIDSIENLPRTGLSKIINDLISELSFNGWAWLAVITSILFALFFIAYYFSASSRNKRVFFSISLVSFLVAVLSVVFAYMQYDIQQSKKFAIVFAEETSIKAEPNPRADEAFILHEGTKVKVLESFSGFIKIELADGRQGWIPKEDMKQL